ncbi:MAG: hypothetical protein OEZ38_12220, partial [Gammaproteobacteria bacterium]|nr:hypothetical protein [Gammaproteobacteria bacterium]
AVIERLLDRYYRSNGVYTLSEKIEREKTGRRDDNVLIGGITNPALIDAWKKIITECQIPLIGIWTLPMLSKGILQLIGEKSKTVLLVSQQVNSNLRQTFFRGGKMLSSRQSVINQDAEDISNIGKFAAPEVKRTVTFLRNQRLIEPGEIVHIHILGSDEQIASLESEFRLDSLDEINVHRLSDLQAKAGVEGLSGKFSDGIFSWLCASQLPTQAHYGETREYSQYYYVLAGKAMKMASVLIALSAMLITELNISEAIEYERSVTLLGEQAQEYKKIYKSRFEEYENVFEHARSMNAAVDLADRIKQNGKTSPLDFMINLSEVLTQSGLADTKLDKIDWKIEQYKDQGGSKEIRKDKVDVTVEDPVRHVGVVYGRINVSDKNYRGSVARVNKIITALNGDERVEQAEVLEMPVEVRSQKAFTDESGISVNEKSRKMEGQFSLKVIMRAATSE